MLDGNTSDLDDLSTLPTSPLPSGIESVSHIAGLLQRATEPDVPRPASRQGPNRRAESPPLDRSSILHHHARNEHHHGKSDHLRRLEDRIDELQQQMLTTQHMIGELTDAIRKQSREHRASNARQNLRVLSGKALMVSGGLQGPSSSIPIATAFLSSLRRASPTTRTANEAGENKPLLDTPPQAEDAPEGSDKFNEERAQHVVSHEAPIHDPRKNSRKISASNPVALLPGRNESRPSVSMAVAHAVSFVADVSKAASDKKLRTKQPAPQTKPLAKGLMGFGPVLSRRFSISTLDQSGFWREGRMSKVVKWSKNLFKGRVEPMVSPEDIQNARAGDAKVLRFTIRHDSPSRTVWDSVVMLMIIVDIVVTPLSLSFQYFPPGLDVYNTVGNVIFATDFLVNTLSSYTTPRGVLVSGPAQTARHYLFSPWSLPDFLSWFPFEIFVSSNSGRFLGIAKVIRLAKVSQLARRFQSAKKAGMFRFIKLLGIVFIVSHCLSCYWNWAAEIWRHEEEGYVGSSLGHRYAHCWALVIGSLNASPPAMYSTIEEISVAVFMLIGNVLQATVFGSVAVLIQSFDEEEVAYNKKLISTYERCRFLDIPEKLARRIQGYYENLYQETRSVNPDADAFINELSPALICEVKFQLYRDMIKQIPFLSATHINPVVIEMLILHLRTVIYMQDDVLIRKGEFGDWMGFIGSKGSVGVLDPKSDTRKIIRILRKGDYFGEMALLQRAKRSTTAIALSWVQIHVLCRNDLDDVKDQYPEQGEILEKEITKYMKSKVTYK